MNNYPQSTYEFVFGMLFWAGMVLGLVKTISHTNKMTGPTGTKVLVAIGMMTVVFIAMFVLAIIVRAVYPY